MMFNKCVSLCCAWGLLVSLLVTAIAEERMDSPSDDSRRHMLDIHSSPFHRISRLMRAHSKLPEDFRKLTARGVPTVEMDYGDLHPLDERGHRKIQTRPDIFVNYPFQSSQFVPLRINYLDDPIRNLLGTGSTAQDDYINYILNNVLPDAKQLWQTYLTFVSAIDTLPLTSAACWGMYPNVISATVLQSGLPDADIAVFVSMQRNLTTINGAVLNVCTDSDTLVVSTFCEVDQYGRPVIGLINFCPPDVVYGTNKTNTTRSLKQDTYPHILDNWQTSPPISNGTATIESKDLMVATVHQLGHVLAMNYDLYRNFYDIQSGLAFTPVHELQTATCSDSTKHVVLSPSTNTLLRTSLPNGLVYFNFVTPRISSVVQSHFNCPSLTGARLENDPSQDGCVASHFNQRLFLGEIMSHLSFQTLGVMSPITLALFEDSGWYTVNYTDTYLPYGQGWGCDFVFGDCIVNDTVPDYGKGVYCSTPTVVESDGSISLDKNDIYCDPLHQKWAVCDLFDKTQVPSGFGNLNASMSWFSNTNLLSSTDGFDSCPLPILTLQVDCNDTATSLGVNYQGEAYGAHSRCINAEMAVSKRKIPGCFKVTCDAGNFQVVVNGIKCKYDGEVHTIKTVDGATASFECPRMSLVCPELFCPADCAGRGTCDYTQKQKRPHCNCTQTTTSAKNCQPVDDTASPPTPSLTPRLSMPTRRPISTSSSSSSSAFHRSVVTSTPLLCWCLSVVAAVITRIR